MSRADRSNERARRVLAGQVHRLAEHARIQDPALDCAAQVQAIVERHEATIGTLTDEEIADPPSHSLPDVVLVLRRAAPIARPVDLARLLKAFGLRLGEAHKVLDRIVADEVVELNLGGADRAAMVARLAEFGVAAEQIRRRRRLAHPWSRR